MSVCRNTLLAEERINEGTKSGIAHSLALCVSVSDAGESPLFHQ